MVERVKNSVHNFPLS